ncbi:hypothetical protein [Sphingobacterium siyangense]|uniref:hypothetical protein n=1 Tax=Sphingobacterium siyangense TaxID=459529 RepID=UPI003DA25FA2
MKLSQISLRAKFLPGKNFKEFNEECWSIAEMYWSFLRKYNTDDVRKCVISVGEDPSEVDKITSHKGFREVYKQINFDQYFEMNPIEKKSLQLDLIHSGMTTIGGLEKWGTEPLLKAYKYCLDNDLNYKFFINSKYKRSPNCQWKLGLWCEWEINCFKLFWVLFDKTGREINRDLITEGEPSGGEIVYYLDYKWDDNNYITIRNKSRQNIEMWKIKIL